MRWNSFGIGEHSSRIAFRCELMSCENLGCHMYGFPVIPLFVRPDPLTIIFGNPKMALLWQQHHDRPDHLALPHCRKAG